MTSTILTTGQASPNNILRSDNGRPTEPNVLLTGGKGVPDAVRTHRVDRLTDRLKLELGNRYEHFEATSETREVEGRALHVYAWIYRTYVAE
ncbi:DUF5988 family protein [Streptomyces capillispiralis]|uniref:Uncharacterized protein n=1 Tax=Streptomyces capillispiralis TaxID=68182 RepID=A0A561TAJ9_9ACTN|nr:DUF5988 family protein [Streptomyces capillispiralis]TWF84130.1 hypothetical protein FHX78_111064 [Streptomyces capillispiralis]GHH92976.1 hypothetical protein GCM10017779_34330 [Streptomyces capillispiralis]